MPLSIGTGDEVELFKLCVKSAEKSTRRRIFAAWAMGAAAGGVRARGGEAGGGAREGGGERVRAARRGWVDRTPRPARLLGAHGDAPSKTLSVCYLPWRGGGGEPPWAMWRGGASRECGEPPRAVAAKHRALALWSTARVRAGQERGEGRIFGCNGGRARCPYRAARVILKRAVGA